MKLTLLTAITFVTSFILAQTSNAQSLPAQPDLSQDPQAFVVIKTNMKGIHIPGGGSGNSIFINIYGSDISTIHHQVTNNISPDMHELTGLYDWISNYITRLLAAGFKIIDAEQVINGEFIQETVVLSRQ